MFIEEYKYFRDEDELELLKKNKELDKSKNELIKTQKYKEELIPQAICEVQKHIAPIQIEEEKVDYKKLDFEIPISLSSPYLLIPKSNLIGGRWDISVDWSYEGKEYLSKETILY